jgi:hypothetical protein
MSEIRGHCLTKASISINVRTVTASSTLLDTDTVVLFEPASNITFTLPPATVGRVVIFKKSVHFKHTITISVTGGACVDGAASITFSKNSSDSLYLIYTGTSSCWIKV